jgi:hypothetical protein
LPRDLRISWKLNLSWGYWLRRFYFLFSQDEASNLVYYLTEDAFLCFKIIFNNQYLVYWFLGLDQQFHFYGFISPQHLFRIAEFHHFFIELYYSIGYGLLDEGSNIFFQSLHLNSKIETNKCIHVCIVDLNRGSLWLL